MRNKETREKEKEIFMKSGFTELQAIVLSLVRDCDYTVLEYLSKKLDEVVGEEDEVPND